MLKVDKNEGLSSREWQILSKKWESLAFQSRPRRFFNHAEHTEAINDISNRIKQSLDRFGVRASKSKVKIHATSKSM